MSAPVARLATKINKFMPYEVYPLIGMLSIACGFGTYTAFKEIRKHGRVTDLQTNRDQFAEYSPVSGRGH